MFDEWELPKFLLCGGFTDHLMFVYLWLSSGGTKSVLHTDSYENLHCVVSGRKEFVLIEPHYAEVIGPEHQEKGFFDIDVERWVDTGRKVRSSDRCHYIASWCNVAIYMYM